MLTCSTIQNCKSQDLNSLILFESLLENPDYLVAISLWVCTFFHAL